LVSIAGQNRIKEMKRPLLVIVLFALASLAQAQEPKISASTDSAQYKIGQWILLHVDAELPQAVDSLVVAAKDSLGAFEILNLESFPPASGHQRWTFRLTIFDTGAVFIPPVPFTYKSQRDSVVHTAYSNPTSLSIVGIPVDLKGDIKDIKPPLDAPWKFEDLLPYLIALLIIALAAPGYYYYRKWKRRREEAFVPLKPAIPPGQAALTALRILEDKHLWQQGKVKEYYSEVTEIVRRFLEDQHGLLALESTSDEIMQQLRQLPEAQAFIREFRSFFTAADLVKFAKYLPPPEEHDHELRWAYEVVRALIPRPTLAVEEQEVENVR